MKMYPPFPAPRRDDADRPADAPAASDTADTPTWHLDDVVSGLRRSREVTHNVRHRGRIRELPSRKAIGAILDELCAALFPTHYGRPDLTDEDIDHFVGSTLSHALRALSEQVRRGLLFGAEDELDGPTPRQRAEQIVRAFAAQLVPIRALLVSDLRAAFEGDPAATSISEVLLCYPGTIAIIYHRLAHALWHLGARFVARLISDISHSMTGIDIHPAASIGGSFFIDHGTGVVIGETAIIGEHVRLYQHVTLGAKRFPADDEGVLIKGNLRHPVVEDDVVIYAGATVLGRITIGHGSTIGGNVWLTYSVPPNSSIAQAQMRNA
ncbi:MAG: serine O-acetyltransferase EpsC [Janthinobacterium lividum]